MGNPNALYPKTGSFYDRLPVYRRPQVNIVFNIKICNGNVSFLIDIRDPCASDSQLVEIFWIFSVFSHFSQFLVENDVFGPDVEVKSVQYHNREETYQF